MKVRSLKALNPVHNLLGAAVVISVFFWFFEAAVHAFIFKAGTFGEEVFTLDLNEIWMRLLIALLLISFGGYAQYLMEKRKSFALELKRERDISMMYFDFARVIMLVLDRDGKVVRINKKGCEVLGYEPEDVIGREWFENFVPEYARFPKVERYERALSGEPAQAGGDVCPIIAKDGKHRVIAWHNTVLKDENGAVIGTLNSGIDETERIMMDENLRSRLDELERFFKLTVGREIKMKELRERVKELESRLEKNRIS